VEEKFGFSDRIMHRLSSSVVIVRRDEMENSHLHLAVSSPLHRLPWTPARVSMATNRYTPPLIRHYALRQSCMYDYSRLHQHHRLTGLWSVLSRLRRFMLKLLLMIYIWPVPTDLRTFELKSETHLPSFYVGLLSLRAKNSVDLM